ncbi:hypothetical protein [Hyphomicrobium sp. CS1GBMeth3]|uniref:hypothetical protein n=1 Tax=Hyphomicrobium sp. CS1GBMeth3 TaxID=1892845 RepID=UPI001114DD6D|nr:hypothetical protein [Hyphomicrobium sp. CS1GBMeth3]
MTLPSLTARSRTSSLRFAHVAANDTPGLAGGKSLSAIAEGEIDLKTEKAGMRENKNCIFLVNNKRTTPGVEYPRGLRMLPRTSGARMQIIEQKIDPHAVAVNLGCSSAANDRMQQPCSFSFSRVRAYSTLGFGGNFARRSLCPKPIALIGTLA